MSGETTSGLYVKHRRTGMYVARQERPKSASFRMPCSNWRWVRSVNEATAFTRSDVIHPILQMGIEASAIVVNGKDDLICMAGEA